MANFNELSGIKQWGLVIGVAVLLSAALYFTLFKTQRDSNEAAEKALANKLQENAQLEPYRSKLQDMDRQVANLKQQLEIEKRIVPDEKDVDGFIKMLDAEAMRAGIEVRRYTAKPVNSKEYYTEVPFELEVDGSYYSLLTFFDQVSKLERIVTVSGLQLATPKKSDQAQAKHHYQYAANESVVATCTATTFFSHDTVPAATPTGKGRS
ncbi:MAG: type 4a pilus biogenesis protein PilO [Acidobacteria bacterium]|nr:type 4a pilus biogenesis protein PilO [Acidobacteriota bacterium]